MLAFNNVAKNSAVLPQIFKYIAVFLFLLLNLQAKADIINDSIASANIVDNTAAFVNTKLVADNTNSILLKDLEVNHTIEIPNLEEAISGSYLYNILVPAGPLIIGGLYKKGIDFRLLRNGFIPNTRVHIDDYLQYLPAAALIIAKLSGAKTNSSWVRMLVSDAFSIAIMAASVNILKNTVSRTRPDNSKSNSFPSGHTATAFMCASMLSKEFNCISPWIGVGGYVVASSVGILRIINNKHYLGDVLMGAGLGIISTELGYLFADLIFKDKGIKNKALPFKLDPFRKPAFIGFNFGTSLPLRRFCQPGNRFKLSPGTEIAVEGAGFINYYLGFGAKIAASDYGLIDLKVGENTENNNPYKRLHLSRITSYAGLYGSHPLNSYIYAGASLMGGYNYYAYAIDNLQTIEESGGFGLDIGLNMMFLVRNKLGFRLYANYELSDKIDGLHSSGIMHYFSCGTAFSIAL